MDINSAFNSGLQGLYNAQSGLERNAVTIARETARTAEGSEDINTALVESLSYQRQGEASVRVVQATDEMLGTLLNERA